ncbi:MAG: hypothetical protein REI96_04435 [Flavobacterium nitrogenifigens]|uniref:hypothetical protein n=1 Tax=Flavobacterium nitrogenifigens TaxID=1617283 RepID=UPI002809E20F|nr:hypothetical protein [Flavobacterium nitrogenifigens]MDQ8011671.1 hypothetical protein [Flavobacterium nitrogenifigens]
METAEIEKISYLKKQSAQYLNILKSADKGYHTELNVLEQDLQLLSTDEMELLDIINEMQIKESYVEIK